MTDPKWETVGSIRKRWTDYVLPDDLQDDLPARIVHGQDGRLSVDILAQGVAQYVAFDVSLDYEAGRG